MVGDNAWMMVDDDWMDDDWMDDDWMDNDQMMVD